MAFMKISKDHPDAKRPWKAPGGKAAGYVAVASSLFMVVMMVYTVISAAVDGDPTMAVMALVFFGIIGFIRYMMRRDMSANPDRYAEDAVELELQRNDTNIGNGE